MPRLPQPATLGTEEREAPPPHSAQVRSASQLWLAAQLTNLPLCAVADPEGDRPAAVFEPHAGRLRVVAANAPARRLGIASGLSLGAALALFDSLELLERSGTAERAALESLATWSERLTPTVSLDAPDAILLELRGSLRLFGGLAKLKRLLGDELGRRGLTFRLATAPTPLAARWLARLTSIDVPGPGRLTSRLAALPVSATGWPDRIQESLRRMGIRTVGGCLRLSRAGFARRLGRRCLDELDRALGRRPDPRPHHRSPRTLSWIVEYATETRNGRIFARSCETGTARLAADLRALQAQIAEITLEFHHPRGGRTTDRIRFVEPVHEVARMLEPLGSRLERLVLTEPVVAFGLRTGPLQPMQIVAPGLLADAGGAPDVSEFALVERLRGRFGMNGVHGIALNAEHRPEMAWLRLTEDLAPSGAAAAGPAPPVPDRPLWLLPKPRVLPAETFMRARAARETAPERIESGWWDGADVRRDYYTVIARGGEKLWVYRDRGTRQWYLHGVFG